MKTDNPVWLNDETNEIKCPFKYSRCNKVTGLMVYSSLFLRMGLYSIDSLL